jgi:quinolinate synthase
MTLMEIEEMKSRIEKLKREKNIVILAHNYQLPEIYDVADFIGDSFELAIQAQKTDADVIVFCGVHFMAESAKILNPEKRVLIPDLEAGCFLADMVTAESLREKKEEFPNAAVVAYVNSTAAVKAESDACCTSANAVEICRQLPQKQIIFVPDENLGAWVAENLPEKEIIPWAGHCYVHSKILTEKVQAAQKLHPAAITLAHPESPKAIRDLANEVLGTGGMLRFVKNSAGKEFLIATESGMLERLKRESFILAKAGTEKKFWALAGECINMKKITLPKVLNSLENDEFEIEVDEKVAQEARKSLEQMVELTKN